MEKELGITEARGDFANIIEQVQYRGHTYIISRHGKPAAAVVPVKVYQRWKQERREFFDLIRHIQKETDLTPEGAGRLAAEAVASTRTET
jgi:prevent-host-death family protein